jgi:hypothetical protein
MILLALWSGLPATSCLCADGSFKLFCAGHLVSGQGAPSVLLNANPSAQSNEAPRHCPACPSKESTSAASADQSLPCATVSSDFACCGKEQTPADGSPASCCRLIEPPDVTLTSVVLLPDFTPLGLPCMVEVVSAPRLAAAALARPYDVFETGPPVDRVIVHCSLLI